MCWSLGVSVASRAYVRTSHLGTFSAVHNRHYIRCLPLAHAGCNGSHHLAVGALGVMNGVEDRDRRANFPVHARSRSSKHPAVLPVAATAEAEAEAEAAAEEELLVSCV